MVILTLDILIKKNLSLLKDNGSLTLILPTNRLNEALIKAHNEDFSLFMLKLIFDTNKK